MSERVIVGLDIGTSSVKGLALDAEGGAVLASASVAYGSFSPYPGWSEQNPEDWWRATEQVLTRLRAEAAGGGRGGAIGSASPATPVTPVAIGLSGQMHGLVALDAANKVLRPAILWNDQRTVAECAEIEDTIGLGRLIELTGNRALTGFTAPKLLWLRRHEPEVYARIARICLPKDYIRMRLCGAHAIDVNDASGTLLLDVRNRRWSTEVLDALDLDPGWLPQLLESGEPSGITPEGAVVAAGAGDQGAGAVGAGISGPGPASIVLGTSGVVLAALDRYEFDPQARVHAFCHAVPDRWHAMGVMLSAAGSLQWFRDVAAPDVGFGALVGEATGWEPGAEGLTFLPYLAGERTPYADADARGSFTGLSVRHDRGALVRAVLEGVAFGLRDGLDLVAGMGASIDRGRVSGGGARSDLWLRIVASVLELPLERVAVNEGAAYGAALLGGVAAGIWPDVGAAIAQTVKVTDRIDPIDAWVDRYRELRPRFQALYPALKAVGE